MYSYIDESGNTGINLFDDNQPYYFTASANSPLNIERLFSKDIQKICDKIGAQELHANELGLSQLDNIALDLKKLCKKARISFDFHILEKKYLALSKLFDILFDPYENHAVPWHTYNIYLLRMLLMLKLGDITSEDTVKKFWNDCLKSRNNEQAKASFISVCNEIIKNVHNLPDKRSQELISEAMTYAIDHPPFVTYYSDRKMDSLLHSPNFVAFTSILKDMCNRALKSKRNFKLITHDEQSQFQRTLQYYFSIAQKTGPVKLPKYFRSAKLNLTPIKNCDFIISNSKNNYGLQIVDTSLYLMKKNFEGENFSGNLYKLVKYILDRSLTTEFSFRMTEITTNLMYSALMSQDITQEMYDNGLELLQISEKRRQEAMRLANQEVS